MATCVPVVVTTCTQQELIKGFIEGWKKSFNTLPKKTSIAILYAQNAIETGSTNHMYNWNIGNVKYIPSKDLEADDDIQYMMLGNVWEIINGKRVVFQPPNQATWFRAFPTLADGIAFQVDFLKNKRYKNAWAAVEAGSPIQFAHLLKVAGYYTAPEADYAKAVGIYFNKFMKDDSFEKIIASLVAPDPTTGTDHVDDSIPVPIANIPASDPAPETPATEQPVPVTVPASPWASITNFFAGLFSKH